MMNSKFLSFYLWYLVSRDDCERLLGVAHF